MAAEWGFREGLRAAAPTHTQPSHRRDPRGCLHIQSMQSFWGSDSIPERGRAVTGWESLELQRVVCTAGLSAEPAPASAAMGDLGCVAWEWVREHPHDHIPMTASP